MKNVILKLNDEVMERYMIFASDKLNIELESTAIMGTKDILKIYDEQKCVFYCPLESVERCQICDDLELQQMTDK